MSNSRRSSNGRSPLVNQQRQITSFFTKSSSSPSPTPSPSSILPKSHSKLTPTPNPKITPKLTPTSTTTTSTTPSPNQTKRNKPLLVIGPTQSSPITPRRLLDDDLVGKRVKVYWPLDKSWYEGCVKSFDKVSGKHWVQYDDSEEELLDLSKEKVEWIEESVKKFRRLRKVSVVEEDDEGLESGGDGDCDDSTDEDWEKNVDKEVVEEESMDLDDDEEEEEDDERRSSVKKKKKQAKIFDFKKRKSVGEDEPSSSKKSKSGEDVRNRLIDQINNDSE